MRQRNFKLPAGVFCLIALIATMFIAACGGHNSADENTSTNAKDLTCDDTLKTAFKPDSSTTVLMVKQYKKGDTILPNLWTPGATVANDVCLVKLVVGPGNPGPAGAPSTSAGVGMEVWLPTPANWNGRIHNIGNGGWGGTSETSLTYSSESSPQASAIAAVEGAVSATTDMGYYTGEPYVNGDFAMSPDGTVNKTLWTDFSSRHLLVQATISKELATAFYGKAPMHMYFEGGSTGGRESLKIAQAYPELYDGIAAGFPAIQWSGLFATLGWPSFVSQKDLGALMTSDQLNLASNAAISSCDMVNGQHLGYILNPQACTYDPTKDKSVLCTSSGGTNTTAACLSTAQANAMNKMWYGPTSDGSVPSPAVDVGWERTNPTGIHRWYGFSRGTSMLTTASAAGSTVFLTSQLALSLQDPTIAGAGFINATGNGADGWKQLSYGQYSNGFDRTNELQDAFADINTNSTDLSAFKARGGKLMLIHGLSDPAITAQQSINYYNQVAQAMGGMASIQGFFRFYLVPGMGHGYVNGTANQAVNPPLPDTHQEYDAVVNWVENGVSPPDRIELPASVSGGGTAPMCAYPTMRTYSSGDVNLSSSYTCS